MPAATSGGTSIFPPGRAGIRAPLASCASRLPEMASSHWPRLPCSTAPSSRPTSRSTCRICGGVFSPQNACNRSTRNARCAAKNLTGGASARRTAILQPDRAARIHTMAKVTTGTGDTGYTGLLGEQRVPKYDPRPDTFGTVDEATSALGLARALSSNTEVKQIIYQVQQELYLLMGELATPPENYEKMGLRMTPEHVQRLEQVENALKAEVEIPNKFIIPGDTPDGAALDLARTIIRRAERMAVKLLHDGVIQNGEVVRYLNRLSDLIFILARYIEVKSSLAELPDSQ